MISRWLIKVPVNGTIIIPTMPCKTYKALGQANLSPMKDYKMLS
jgi:hypothetical protein